jgi:hypothetical protein
MTPGSLTYAAVRTATTASEQTRRSVKDMERFRRVLFKAFDDCEDRERLSAEFVAMQESNTDRLEVQPPKAAKFIAEKRARFKTRVHEMGTEDTASDEGEDKPTDRREAGSVEVMEPREPEWVVAAMEDGETEVQEKRSEPETVQNSGDEEYFYLHAVSMDPEGKRPPPCFDFALKGKCEYGKDCKYSHNADDIKEFLRLKELGLAGFKKEAAATASKHGAVMKNISNRETQAGYKQAPSNSSGSNLKSGNSLRGGGSTARRT